MEVALDTNQSLLTPIKQGVASTFTNAGNLFNNMAQGLKNFSDSLPPYTPVNNQSYPVFWGGFCHPYHLGHFGHLNGHYHRHFGGFYPGSVFCGHNALFGIPTGVTHCAPIYSDPMPDLRSNLPDIPAPAPVNQMQLPKPQPMQLNFTPQQSYNPLSIAPIFGASFDFYNTIGVNPYEYTTPSFYNFGSNITTVNNTLPGGFSTQFGGQTTPQTLQQQIQNMTPDMFMHPERYSKPQVGSGAQTSTTSSSLNMPFGSQISQSTAQAQNTPEKQKNEEVASVVESNCRDFFQMRPASYFTDLKNKIAKGGKLSDNEKKLYDNYVALMTTYSPFEVDEKGNIKAELEDSKTYRNIIQLSQYIAAGNTEQIKSFIDNTSPLELAAVEYYWNMLNKPQKELNAPLEKMHEEPFRDMLKDATVVHGFKWTKWNTSAAKEIFNALDDKVAMVSPVSMSNSLYQALKGHHLGGWGLDEDRVVRLLTMMNGNKVFADAVKAEFPDSPEDLINRTWTASSETKELAKQVFGPANNNHS